MADKIKKSKSGDEKKTKVHKLSLKGSSKLVAEFVRPYPSTRPFAVTRCVSCLICAIGHPI